MGRISQLYLPGNHYDIGTAAKIYARQCSSTVRTLLEAYDGDMTQIIQTAEKAKLNRKQRDALNEYQVKKEDDYEQSLWDAEAARNSAAILEKVKSVGTVKELRKWKSGEDARKAEECREHWTQLGIDAWRPSDDDLPFDSNRRTENDG